MTLKLNQKQLQTKDLIEAFAVLQKLDPAWAVSIAFAESSLGINQLSPTGCKGVFGMSSIAMRDLLQSMIQADDEIVDISCGGAFLHVLLDRHKTIEDATGHYCDPKDRPFYIKRILNLMKEFKNA